MVCSTSTTSSSHIKWQLSRHSNGKDSWAVFNNNRTLLYASCCYCSVAVPFVTSWPVAHQTSLSMGFPGQGYWSGLPVGSFSRGCFWPGIELRSPALQADSLLSEPSGKQVNSSTYYYYYYVLLLLPGKFHGQRNLAWVHKVSPTSEHISMSTCTTVN